MSSSGSNPYVPPSAESQREAKPIAEQHFVLAELIPRLFARLIDIGLLALLLIPGFAVLGLHEGVGLALLAAAWLGVSVTQWILIARTGQSIGKRWMGLRIVGIGGQPVGFVSGVVVREWLIRYAATLLAGIPLIVDLLMLFTPKRQTLHDRAAKTLVIEAGTAGDPYA